MGSTPLVTGHDKDGRRHYDPQAKLELVRECLKPGESVANTALRHGINTNLLRKWITNSVQRSGMGTPAAVDLKVLAVPNPFVAVRIESGASPTATTTVLMATGTCALCWWRCLVDDNYLGRLTTTMLAG